MAQPVRLADADADAFAALLITPPPPPATPTPVPLPGGNSRFAVTLPCCTFAECAAIIAATEARGFITALLNIGHGREVFDPHMRDSQRCIIDSPAFADALFARIAHALPATMEGGRWRLVGLNERLRFLRYDVGQKFRIHRDGFFERGAEAGSLAGQRTHVTVLLYLNEGYTGCATTVYDDYDEAPPLAILPTTGLVLLHDHRILHAAPPLITGRKYVLRTDALYERVAGVEAGEAWEME